MHWGTEWNEARDRLVRASEALRREKKRLMCGEDCLVEYQEAEVAVLKAQQAVEDFRNFRVAGASQQLFRGTGIATRGVTAGRRAPSAVMEASASDQPANEPADADAASSLEEKMANWEASEEEQRSKTLGGNLPLVGMPGKPGRMTRKDQPTKMDGFDMGMAVSGVILVPLTLAVLAFPFLIGGIDVNSVGPPPTV
jgi:hypothetical protein